MGLMEEQNTANWEEFIINRDINQEKLSRVWPGKTKRWKDGKKPQTYRADRSPNIRLISCRRRENRIQHIFLNINFSKSVKDITPQS